MNRSVAAENHKPSLLWNLVPLQVLEPNVSKAAELYKQSAALGNASAQWMVGVCGPAAAGRKCHYFYSPPLLVASPPTVVPCLWHLGL